MGQDRVTAVERDRPPVNSAVRRLLVDLEPLRASRGISERLLRSQVDVASWRSTYPTHFDAYLVDPVRNPSARSRVTELHGCGVAEYPRAFLRRPSPRCTRWVEGSRCR